MKKSLVYLSFATIVAISIGCGGDSTTPTLVDDNTTPPVVADTTAPTITNSNTFSIEELKVRTITLTSNEANTTFSENSTDATINGDTLTFTAPTYIDGSDNNYTVRVTATDSSQNSSSKDFIFTVFKAPQAESAYIAITGDKEFDPVGDDLKGPSGLIWKNEATDAKTYAAAETYCNNGGWRVPKEIELTNLMDYTRENDTGNSYLIDDDFTAINIVDGPTAAWTSENSIVYYKAGTIGEVNASKPYTVLCVNGDPSDDVPDLLNTDTNTVKDSTTNLEWEIVVQGDTKNFAGANSSCTGSWSLPTINQLRSIIDSDNTILYITESSATYSIWSSTAYTNDVNGTYSKYFTVNLGNNANVIVDLENQTHHVTCVREIQE